MITPAASQIFCLESRIVFYRGPAGRGRARAENSRTEPMLGQTSFIWNSFSACALPTPARHNTTCKSSSSTQANFEPVKKSPNSGIMIDKATCVTPETTNSSPLSIGAVENEGDHAAVQAPRPSAANPSLRACSCRRDNSCAADCSPTRTWPCA